MSQRLYVCARSLVPEGQAGQVTAALKRRFGPDAVASVEDSGLAALTVAEAVLALIDSSWADDSSDGAAFLRDPTNLVRAALLAAAQMGKIIIPVLLDGATMPAVDDLPDALRFLHFRNARSVHSGASFPDDIDRLCRIVEDTLRGRRLAILAWVGLCGAVAWPSLVVLPWLLGFSAPVHDSRQLSALLFLPTVAACFGVGWVLLRAKRWLPAVILACCAVAIFHESWREVTPTVFSAPFSTFDLPASMFTHTLLAPIAGVVVLTLLLVALRPGALTYSHRSVRFIARSLAEDEIEEAGSKAGVYVSCRPEDMGAAYVALCSYLDKELTQDKNYQRPILQPHADDWQAALDRSTDVVVVIGPRWRSALDDTSDCVRRELEAAIRQGKTLIPVLLDGAEAPQPERLPVALAPLGFVQSVRVRGTRGNESDFADALFRLIGSDRGFLSLIWTLWGEMPFFQFSPDLFISYRQKDSAQMADRIYRAMRRPGRVGRGVFRDINAISAGVDFSAVVMSAIRDSAVVLVLIGPRWLSLSDDVTGRRRLDSSTDMVRKEIATALRQEKTIIPVLFDGARMPTADELPQEIAALAGKAPFRVGDAQTFACDMKQLYKQVRRPIAIQQLPVPLWLSVAALALWGALWMVYESHPQTLQEFIFHLRPAWCFAMIKQRSFIWPLCFTSPDPAILRAMLALAISATTLTFVLSVVAAFYMLRDIQGNFWPIGLVILLIMAGLSLASVIAAFQGASPAIAEAFDKVNLTQLLLPQGELVTAATFGTLIAAYLIPYFWRSKGKPKRD